MGRLTQEQWEQARAEYEVRGISLGEIAKARELCEVKRQETQCNEEELQAQGIMRSETPRNAM